MAAEQFKKINVPTKGLYNSAVADLVSPDYTPSCMNVRFRYGKIVKAPGRSIALSTTSKPILDFFQFVQADGCAFHGALTGNDDGAGGDILLYDNASCSIAAVIGQVPGGYLNPDNTGSRYSWTDGEEQVFIVRNSQVYALTKVVGGGWSGQVLAGAPQCRLVEYFANRVFALNCWGAPNRLQWSALGNYLDWSTIVDTTGYHGGFLDLYDGYVEPITGGKVLNDRLVTYRRRSIVDMVATGDPTEPFLPQGRVYGIGCAAPWTLQSVGQFHIFLANDWNVYTWDGAQLQVIGTPVHQYIRKVLDTAHLEYSCCAAFAATFMGFKEYWLVFPAVSGQSPTMVMIYDYLRDTWTKDTFPNLTALYEILERNRVGSPGYSEFQYPLKWPMLMAGVEGQFCLIDERVDGDRFHNPSTGAMEMWFDSPDMYWDQNSIVNGTLYRVMVNQDMPQHPEDPLYNVEISIDRGLSYPIVVPITPLQTKWGYQFADVNVTNNVYRIRFHCPAVADIAPNPSWRSYTLIYVPSGEFFPTDRPVAGVKISSLSINEG